MNDKIIVVVGGSGFIGTKLCKLFRSNGIDFLIVDKRVSDTFPEETVIADVRDLGCLNEAIPSAYALVNLAAEHRDNVRPTSLYYDVNVCGARNIAHVASERRIRRIVFTSSVACYGHAPALTGEEGAINPFNEYGKTKSEAEQVFINWRHEEELNRSLVIIRPTVVFGEQNRGNVYNLLRLIALRRFVMIGSGHNIKSMAYVGNLVAFIHHMLSTESGISIVNYVDEPQMEVRELVALARSVLGHGNGHPIAIPYWLGYAGGISADLISRITGAVLPISAIRVRKFVSTSSYRSCAHRYGFSAPYSLGEALKKTIEHEFIQGGSSGPVFDSE